MRPRVQVTSQSPTPPTQIDASLALCQAPESILLQAFSHILAQRPNSLHAFLSSLVLVGRLLHAAAVKPIHVAVARPNDATAAAKPVRTAVHLQLCYTHASTISNPEQWTPNTPQS